MPAAAPLPPQEAPIPAPIPPPARRNLPPPVFHEPYAPVEVAAPVLPVAAAAGFFEFPEADEQVSVVQEVPRRIQLSNLPLNQSPVHVQELQTVEEPVPPAPEPVEATEEPEASQKKPKSKPFRRETRKIGRNEQCPCGSGKKYKKCCGR